MELTLHEALIKGVEAHKAGKVQEADRYYTAILKEKPEHPDANHNMGVLAVNVGKPNKSIPFLKAAIEANPSVDQFWITYIETLLGLGQTTEAQIGLNRAEENGVKSGAINELQEKLSVMLGGNNLKGNSQDSSNKGAEGNPVATIEVLEPLSKELEPLFTAFGHEQFSLVLNMARELQIAYPNSATLYNFLGAANAGLKQYDLAIECYKHALEINPSFCDPCINMADAWNAKGNVEESIHCLQQALKIEPNHPDAFYNLGVVLKAKFFLAPNPELAETIQSLLDHKVYAVPRDIVKPAFSLLRFDPLLKRAFDGIDAENFERRVCEVVEDLSQIPLLLTLMSVSVIPSMEIEDLLTRIRAATLFNLPKMSKDLGTLKFQSALALQCFTNEYIYHQTDRETDALQKLEEFIEINLGQGKPPSTNTVLCLASYKPLHEYAWYRLLSLPNELYEVENRQVLEPEKEERIKAEILTLKEITDNVSSKVRTQYEENPYPRWVSACISPNPISISRVVREGKIRLFNTAIVDVDAPDILVAGCGTGQHSLAVASRFKKSKVLAVDLSLSSLAYAKRKTNEMGVNNIEYLQADILDLEQLDRRFDIIESGGVLHHMEAPLEGWKVLTNCLKPGGLMKIALYSKLARQDVIQLRNEIAQSAGIFDSLTMKSFRKVIRDSDQEHHQRIRDFDDFYCLSELRDLLFHVQEHQFTLPQIRNCLSILGLKFCGFENAQIVQDFQGVYKNPNDPYDLDKWQLYENDNPRTFISMYQFWCQKP